MFWLPLSIGAYFLNAVASIVDKSLLEKAIPQSRLYAFFVGVLGLIGLVVAPFGISIPSAGFLLISFVTGAIFVLALALFFTALQRSEASRVVPFVGGVQPLGIFLLSFLFLNETLSLWQIIAFMCLVAGGVIISLPAKKQPTSEKKLPWVGLALAAGVAFACFYVLTKYLYLNESFVNGFAWPRIGAAIAACFLLFEPAVRTSLKKMRQSGTGKVSVIFLFGQGAGALSFIVLNYAISLGSVTLINALQGTQYVFVFVMAVALAWKFPKLLGENITPRVIIQKVIAIGAIVLGLILLWL